MLLSLVVIIDYIVRIRNTVLEEMSDVLYDDARLHAGELSAAAASQGVAGQERRLAFQKLHDLNVEDRSALVNEGEGKIGAAALVGGVIDKVETCHVGHLFLRIAAVKAKGHNSACNLFLHLGCCALLHGVCWH